MLTSSNTTKIILIMYNKNLNAYIAVISHKRPQNIAKMQEITGGCTFFVNAGEAADYAEAGYVVECGTDICTARNKAIDLADGLPCIQVSDDLRHIKKVLIKDGKRIQIAVDFTEAVTAILAELKKTGYFFGGVAVNNNALNYTGTDYDYDKLVVNDLICILPAAGHFDADVALKEDYDMTIRQLIEVGGLVRCNQYLCDFPHRQNVGGANHYRNDATEGEATARLLAKWPGLIKAHPTRAGQIALNYQAINARKQIKQGSLW